MKTSLHHLPAVKRRALARVLEILHEEFEDAPEGQSGRLEEARAHPQDRALRLLRPRRLGRRARAPPRATAATSTCLIVVNNKKLAEYEPYWHKAADRLLRDREIDTPVSFIVHSPPRGQRGPTQGPVLLHRHPQGTASCSTSWTTSPSPSPSRAAQRRPTRTAKEHFEERLPTSARNLDMLPV